MVEAVHGGVQGFVGFAERLGFGGGEVAASTFMLDEEDALPEEVDKALLVAEFFDGLLEAGDTFARRAKDFKKLVVKGLGLAALVMRVFPFRGEDGGSGADFVPA